MSFTRRDVAIIIQCRLSSTRLPEKAIKNLGGATVLEWTLRAMKKVNARQYCVATDEDSYEILEPIAKNCGFEIFSGPLEDVLARYCMVIRQIKCKIVLRATADNPFLFYEAADSLLDEFLKQSNKAKCDYMTYTGLPHGSGVEVFNADSLLKAASLTNIAYDHEHVGPSLYNHKNIFTCLFYKAPRRFNYPDFRTTIDTMSDFRRALSVVENLSGGIMPEQPYTTEQIVSAMKNPSVNDMILFVPSLKKGQGTGHLRRCLKTAIDTGGFIFIPENAELEQTSEIVNMSLENGLKEHQIIRQIPEKNEFSLIVSDYFKLDKELAKRFMENSIFVAIDEGSSFSSYADFLLDIIPSYKLERDSNLSLPAFIEQPKNKKREWNLNIKKVLVCLGGEDPANLTIPASLYFAKSGYDVTAILSKSKIPSEKIQNVSFIEPILELKEHLYEYDLVVTHYGLTAFEANSAGCAVILLATSKLHENLAKTYGFTCLTKKQLSSTFNASLFSDVLKLIPNAISENTQKPLGQYVKDIAHGKRLSCPVCKNPNEEKQSSIEEIPDEIVARTEFRTFRRCKNCSMIYISWTRDGEDKKYEKSYFADEYKNQYGKTYLEDFKNIKKNCFKRVLEMNSIVKLNNFSKPTVLDVGCAYGPFLDAANESGWQVFGTDVSDDAVSYVQNKLLYPCAKSVFPDFDSGFSFGINQFDAVTMWYVIEHFSNLYDVLTKVNEILKVGGVFAFSTPSAQGVSARLNRQNFYNNSPSDHFTIWEPFKAHKILKKFGFKIVKIVSTGHHPQRFPIFQEKGAETQKSLYKLLDRFSHLVKWGDTVEIYCRKIK